MKKVLSIVLAALMMLSLASMAFAATNVGDIDGATANNRADVTPGDTLYIYVEASCTTADLDDTSLVRANWDKGAGLVSVTPYLVAKDVTGDDVKDWCIEIKVKKTMSVDVKELVGEVVLKDKSTGTEVGGPFAIDYFVGWGALDADEIMAYTNDLPVVDFTDYSGDITMYWGNVAYPDAILDGKVRTEKPALKYMAYNMDDNDAIVDANPNAGDMTFIAFDAAPDFDYSFDLSISSTIEKGYLYEIGADNKLTKLDYTWETIEGNDFYTIKGIKALGAYVVSEKELTGAAATSDKTNPETGANDMINVAVTMAVVSLAAAAAVAFKKR